MGVAMSFTERSKLPEDRDVIPAIPAGERAIMKVYRVELLPELATLFPHTTIVPLANYPVLKPHWGETGHAYLVTVRGYRLEEFEAAIFELLHARFGKFLELVEALQSAESDGY